MGRGRRREEARRELGSRRVKVRDQFGVSGSLSILQSGDSLPLPLPKLQPPNPSLTQKLKPIHNGQGQSRSHRTRPSSLVHRNQPADIPLLSKPPSLSSHLCDPGHICVSGPPSFLASPPPSADASRPDVNQTRTENLQRRCSLTRRV